MTRLLLATAVLMESCCCCDYFTERPEGAVAFSVGRTGSTPVAARVEYDRNITTVDQHWNTTR